MPLTAFTPGQPWLDTEDRPIQTHGGGLLFFQNTYYWFGENKNGPTAANGMARVDVIGINCYSSTDLYNWTNRGVVLPAVASDPTHDLHPSKVAERPKVIFNPLTRKFVMWLHIDTADYAFARTGVAIADQPEGPYTYLGSHQPTDTDSRDMTLFQDTDTTAYVAFATRWNRDLRIAKLTADYLKTSTTFTDNFVSQPQHAGREAPAIFKLRDRYFMLTSGCTGWDPNPAELATAQHPLGPWTVLGNPCTGPDSENTFHAQPTFVLPLPNDHYIACFDRWNPGNLSDSRYVWLPVHFRNGAPTIPWRDRWTLEEEFA